MTIQDCKFDIAKEFSKYPGGRLREHGPKSGEEFREDILLPLLEKHQHITINMTGAVGYGSSFLDESFGELGKIFGTDKMREKLTLVSDDDPNLVSVVWDVIETGENEARKK